jgi:hypothetical protein
MNQLTTVTGRRRNGIHDTACEQTSYIHQMTARIFVSGIFEIFSEIFGVVILYSNNNQHEISYIIELLMNPPGYSRTMPNIP